jgi:hypothetical protein
VRLPDSVVLRLDSQPNDSLQDILAGHLSADVSVVVPFPHRVLAPADHAQTLTALDLYPRATVCIRPNQQQGQVLRGYAQPQAFEEFDEPDEPGLPAMSPDRVANLRLEHSTYVPGTIDADHATCAICVCEYQEGERISTLPCRHHYHQDCVERWLARRGVCPVCKADVH